MHSFRHHLLTCLALFPLALTACAAAVDGVDDGDEGHGVGATEQAIGERNCPYDYTFRLGVDAMGHGGSKTASPPYGDSSCTNALTGLVTFDPLSGHSRTLQAEYEGPTLQNNKPFPCEAMWVRAIIWRFDNNLWNKVWDYEVQGTLGWDGTTCTIFPVNYIDPNRDGRSHTYVISAQAGVITTFEPVQVNAFYF